MQNVRLHRANIHLNNFYLLYMFNLRLPTTNTRARFGNTPTCQKAYAHVSRVYTRCDAISRRRRIGIKCALCVVVCVCRVPHIHRKRLAVGTFLFYTHCVSCVCECFQSSCRRRRGCPACCRSSCHM